VRTPTVLLSLAIFIVIPGRAAAEPGDGGRRRAARVPRDEAAELARSIEREAQQLATDDCTSACRASASMRGATDRLCAIDPGKRCADARAILADATRRVRDACPACAVTAAPEAPMPGRAHQREPVTMNAPPAPAPESKRGGCAGCATSGVPVDGSAGALALLALAALGRARRRRAA
jgi:MYXO-CTERM domain-containing protein